METILVLAYLEPDGALGKPARESVTAAKVLCDALGAPLVLGLVGESLAPAAQQVGSIGATKVFGVAGPECAAARYGTDAAAAEAICRAAQATMIVAAGTSRVNRVLPGVAHRLAGRVDTHVTGLSVQNGAVSVTRWYYRQRMEAVLQRAQRPWVIVVDPGCFAPTDAAPAPAAIESVPAQLPAVRTTVTGFQSPAADAQTIRPDAELLFVAGAGWTKPQADGKAHGSDAAALILDFLRQSKASLGGSKSLVDLSGEGQAVLPFMTHLNQIGQTGATPRHPKGLATCCHGEEPHTVGWRFINERRAVNLDPNCGWARGKADVLYVADAFAVMAKINALLENR